MLADPLEPADPKDTADAEEETEVPTSRKRAATRSEGDTQTIPVITDDFPDPRTAGQSQTQTQGGGH